MSHINTFFLQHDPVLFLDVCNVGKVAERVKPVVHLYYMFSGVQPQKNKCSDMSMAVKILAF